MARSLLYLFSTCEGATTSQQRKLELHIHQRPILEPILCGDSDNLFGILDNENNEFSQEFLWHASLVVNVDFNVACA